MRFKAKEIFADYDENDVLIIAFSGDTDHLSGPIYFMIQYSEDDSQDRQLGIDTYYIEKNDQSMGGYGGIIELRLDKNRIQIDLSQKGTEHLKEINIEIEFECNIDEFGNLQKRLNQIFSNGELIRTYNVF
ncbi:MAG: hypothetical protein JKY54_07175 [Flavobacteriales bacterium]|nr:hypothetical protein [Flavobacteriales bacterium]